MGALKRGRKFLSSLLRNVPTWERKYREIFKYAMYPGGKILGKKESEINGGVYDLRGGK